MANSSDAHPAVRSDLGQAWAGAWHLWRVIIPRRSITGRLVWGMVWRRNRGGRWIYKKFVEYPYPDDVDRKSVSWGNQACAGPTQARSHTAGGPDADGSADRSAKVPELFRG